jgi:hypothetical protein
VGLAVCLGTAGAQVVIPPPQSGLERPWIPPRGEWLQVLTATDRWLVLQNERGQQFPVAYDSIGQFLIRWPSSLERIAPDDLIEVTGIDLGTNRVATDQVDIYKGPARQLVTPAVLQLLGFNRVMTLFDWERQRTFGINLQYILTPEEQLMPVRLHVVAPAANVQPLQLMIGGNNVVTVVPGLNGTAVTEVTPGDPQFVQPGDMAYVIPLPGQSTPRSLAVGRLVLYKGVGINAFAR